MYKKPGACAFVNVKPKIDYVQTVNKVTKINLRNTAKCHAYLHTLTKTPAKFKRDPL